MIEVIPLSLNMNLQLQARRHCLAKVSRRPTGREAALRHQAQTATQRRQCLRAALYE